MVIFEHKSSDKVILGGSDIPTSVEVTIYEKVAGDTYLINIPSLNIHINTRKKEEIDDLVHSTVMSFFRFWKQKQGIPRFYDHMLALGFSIRSDENHDTARENFNGKKLKKNYSVV